MGEFDDIRPYQDAEVPLVIERLLKNDEFFDAIVGFRFPVLKKVTPKLANHVIKKSLKNKLSKIHTIADVQKLIAVYVERILKTTTTGLTESRLNESSQETSHLFISNHRDIVMDPALISYLLHGSVHGTIQIAIGDNLLKKEYVSDLMRLNKSFIVKRSAQGKDKLLASKQLSQYIHCSIAEGNNVWIAQREGRAKDGIDKTDPAILKMLHMANRDPLQKTTLKDSTNKLHIIPVSISFEYYPCAEMQAREMFEIEKNGVFEKDEETDLNSISKGMNGEKGDIHLGFGNEILAAEDDADVIALQIDQQIILNYKLHSSNYIAYEKLQLKDSSIGSALSAEIKITKVKRQEFEAKLHPVDEELKVYFLRIYANPVINQFRLKAELG
jgi:hypothetical protein